MNTDMNKFPSECCFEEEDERWVPLTPHQTAPEKVEEYAIMPER